MSSSRTSAELLALLDRIAAGDQRAEAALVDEFAAPVFSFLKGFGRLTDDDREELTYETLLDAIKSVGRYDRERKFITWLFSIAKHKALRRLRKERHEWVK